MKSTTKVMLLDWVKTIILAIVLSFVFRTYVAEARWIPSESMMPTLKVGDHLIVDKIAYKIEGIKRGDIVIFNPPPTAQLDEKVLIKRVVGLPGETIAVKNGSVLINGTPIEEPYISEKPRSDFGPYLIPNNEVFVMGDNRNNSFDSRFWGPLPINNIIGKAEFRYYPLNEIGILSHN